MKSDARMTAVKGSAEPPRIYHKIDENPQAAWQLFNGNWLIIAVMGSLLALGLTSTNLRLEPIAFGTTLAIAAALLAVSYHHRLTRGDRTDPKLLFSLGTIGQVILTCAIVGPLSYVAGAIGYPLQDQALLSVDRALGLDPEPIIRYVNDHPWLAIILSRAYGLIKWPLLGIPIVLVLAARYARLQLFVLAMSVALAVAIAISVFVPAIGTYYGLQLPPARYPNIDTSVYAGQLRDILALRDGTLRELGLFKLAGIVSFPSFHAASAVLYMWALWPVRAVGGIAATINILMIAATPVIGAHYLIDLVGGILLAVASILAATSYLKWLKRTQRTSAASAPDWPQKLVNCANGSQTLSP